MTPWSLLSKSLYDFEKRFCNELAELKYKEFNAWQIAKIPLYFNNLKHVTASDMPVKKRKSLLNIFKKSIDFSRLVFNLFLLYMGSIAKGKRRVVFFSFSGDKFSKNEKGYYFNYLIDGFITEKIISNYIYAESSYNGDHKLPSKIRADFKVDSLFLLYPFYRTAVKREVEKAESCINALHNKLELFSKDTGCLPVDINTLKNIFWSFEAEHRMFILFLKCCRPKFIITSEKPGTSFLAAAKKMQVPTLDVQHGIIDQHHPQYIYAAGLNKTKHTMILPQWIGTFGEFHKEQLLQTGFWKKEELVVFGSCRMEMNRKKYAESNIRQHTILIPTQWTYYLETCSFLEGILPLIPSCFKIILKLHPLEEESHVKGYYRLIKEKEIIQIAGKDDDIYALIRSSKLVIGFDSAVLLEAICLGTPCITLCTDACPQGIHSLFHESKLTRSILPIHFTDKVELVKTINSCLDIGYYNFWQSKVSEDGEDLYANNYFENCRQFVQSELAI